MKPVVSILMAHWRRAPLLLNTLKSIANQRLGFPVEIIVVDDDLPNAQFDDACNDAERYSRDHGGGENLTLRTTNTDRIGGGHNQAVPVNVGLKMCTGEWLILQNPECFHVGNLVSGIVDLLRASMDKPYYCARCISLEPGDQFTIGQILGGLDYKLEFLDYPNRPEYCGASNRRPFYFCAGMRRQDFVDLGGLEQSFQWPAYEDDFHSYLVQKNGWEVRILDSSPFRVLHQYHDRPSQTEEYADNIIAMQKHFAQLRKEVERGDRPAVANWGTVL